MKRRHFLIGVATLCASAARAQSSAGKPVRVGILVDFTQADYEAVGQPFVDTLRTLGWIEGRNIIYDAMFADNDVTRLPALAEAMVARNPNLIFAPTGRAPFEARAKTRTIPIVFAAQANLVERGLVQSLAHPGGNVTGVHNIGWELSGKRLQLLKQVFPRVTRVGLLRRSSADASEQTLVEQAAAPLGISVIPVLVKQGDDLKGAFAALPKSRIDALLVSHNALFIITERSRILALAAKQRLPVVAPRGEFADGGALMSYSSILADQYRRAAQLADKILKGAKPADLPVEQPTRFELVINLKTAKVLGIPISQSILAIADRIIE